jgi:integrase
MARRSSPWLRKGRGWYVTIGGRQHPLGPDKNEAYRRFHELMTRPVDGDSSSAPASVLEILEDFLAWTEDHRAPDTFRWYQGHLRSFAKALVEDRGRELLVDQLRPLDVRRWLERHPRWNGTTQRQAITALQRAMNWAERMGYLDRSPLRSIEKPRANVRERTVSAEHYAQMLELTAGDAFRDLLVTSWETGCRPQESLRVEARHVDLIARRWVFAPSEAKGGRRPRIVYLTDAALDVTRRRVKEFPDGPLFRNSRGAPWNGYSVGCRFRRLADRQGERYCLYHFRHTFATRMLTSGLDALTVALLLGHSNPAMLSTTYQHLAHNPEHLIGQLRAASS